MGESAEAGGFDECFRALYPRARSVAYRILGNVTAAEDAAAEAFTRALVSWRRLHVVPYRDAWILRVAANVAIDVRRRARPEDIPGEPIPDAQEATVIRLVLAEALTGLPRRQREVIVLRHMVGMSEQEIARCLHLSVGSVKKHAHRARRGLRDRLGDDWIEGVPRVAI